MGLPIAPRTLCNFFFLPWIYRTTFVYIFWSGEGEEFSLIEHICFVFTVVFSSSCNCAKTGLTVDYFLFFLLPYVYNRIPAPPPPPRAFIAVYYSRVVDSLCTEHKTKQNYSVFYRIHKYDRNSSLVHACFASNSLIACQLEMKCEKYFPSPKE